MFQGPVEYMFINIFPSMIGNEKIAVLQLFQGSHVGNKQQELFLLSTQDEIDIIVKEGPWSEERENFIGIIVMCSLHWHHCYVLL